ncbi:MAG: peptidylprolyl isomerase [candidate division WOR-3 bacterium]
MIKILILFFSQIPVYSDRIIAIVDKKPILESELKEMVDFFKILKPEIEKEEEENLRKKILEQLIENELILYEAKKDTTIKVTQEEVESFIENEIKRIKEELGDSIFKEELKKEGLNEEKLRVKYREQVERNLYIQKYISKYIAPKINITPTELENFYKKYIDSIPELPEGFELSHIFIAIRPSEKIIENARKRADEVFKELKSGSDFGYIALKYSDDKATAVNGGDIGFIQRGTFPPEIEEKIFSYKKGEIIEPIQGDLGFFIFQVVDKKEDKIRLRQIVIATLPSKEDTLRAKEKAKEAFLFAKEKGFEEAVKKYSEDPLTKDRKGYLGFVPIDRLREEVRSSLLKAENGEILGPFYLDFGYHIFKRISYNKGGKPSFDEVKFMMQNLLFQKKVQELLKKKASEIKNKVYVEIFY